MPSSSLPRPAPYPDFNSFRLALDPFSLPPASSLLLPRFCPSFEPRVDGPPDQLYRQTRAGASSSRGHAGDRALEDLCPEM